MDARLVASRLPGIAMYGQPFNAPPFPGYLPYGPTDASAFYSPLQAGENADAWRAGLTQAAAAYYDPAITAHYGYGYGPMGLSDGARRKNATRETTSTLKAWLNEHRKNPYPTKGEKIMLAIITKMTLTQVSTWFANARRRLKKENKMTWSPRNRCGEDDDDDIMDGDDDNNLNNNSNNRDSFTSSANHLGAGESNNSRCSSPSSSTLGNGPVAEGPNRVSGFDLPQQGAHHPFVPRPDITGSFSIRGPTNSQIIAHDKESESKNQRRSSNADGEEEIDLESVDDLNKDTAFVKRSMSNDSHSKEVATSYSAHFNRPIASSPLGNQTASSNNGLFPNVPTPSAFHPSMGNSSHAAAASLLAATRGHSLPPHVLAGMNADQRHSSQGILNIPNPPLSQHLSSFGPAPSKLSPQSSRRNSTSPSVHPYSRNAASSPTSSLASSSSTNCSPLKPKIWSLADVATSQDGGKNTSHEDTKSISSISFPNSSLLSSSPTMVHDRGLHMSHSGQIPSHQTVEGFSQATLRNWMDGMMQHKMAAAAAAAAAMSGGQPHQPFFHGAMLPQHLAAALNPAALAVAASMPRGGDGGRYPHPFSGFAELAAAQQRAHMAAHIAGVHHMQSSPVSAQQHAHTTGISKIMTTPIPSRHRINSVTNTKAHSHVSSSPPHSASQHMEISGFTPLNTRPDSSDSGIVSAETSKDSLTQGNESTNSK